MANIIRFGGGAGGKKAQLATIVVTAPTGSIVTATKGDITLTAPEVNGTWTFSVPEAGTWTLTAIKDSNSSSTTIDVIGSYNAELVYSWTATITGNGGGGATVTVGGTNYGSAATVQVPRGATIKFTANSGKYYQSMHVGGDMYYFYGRIKVNGGVVAGSSSLSSVTKDPGGATYSMVANNDMTIALSYRDFSDKQQYRNAGIIDITYTATAAQTAALEREVMASALNTVGVETEETV